MSPRGLPATETGARPRFLAALALVAVVGATSSADDFDKKAEAGGDFDAGERPAAEESERAVAKVTAEAIANGAPHIALEPKRERPHPPAGLGGSGGWGWAQQHGRTAWMVRLEQEIFPVMAPNRRFGGVFGFLIAAEYWRDDRGGGAVDQGFSLPFVIAGGVRTPVARALLGFGFEAINIDSIDTDAGFGMYAPLAMATVGVDVAGIRIGVDARAVRRWQLGADDFTQVQFVITAGYTLSTVTNKPYY